MGASARIDLARRRFVALLLAGGAAGSTGCADRRRSRPRLGTARGVPAQGRVAEIRSDLVPRLRQAQARLGVPGLSLALVDPDEVLWSEGFGMADQARAAPATDQTRYRAGSLAKPLTALGIAQLAAAGAVDLDAPLTRYLPAFSIRSRFASGDRPITTRDLLCHQSGLPCDLIKGMWSDAAFTSVLPALREEYAAFPPGLVFSYSNLGYSVLGHLAQAVSATPFEQCLHQQVLHPCGMQGSRYRTRPSAEAARGHRQGAAIDPLPLRDVPAHGLETSVAELARLMRALLAKGRLDGRRVLDPGVIAATFAVQNRDSPLDVDLFSGLGWLLEQDSIAGCGRVVRHGARMLGFAGECLMLPERGLGVAVLANAGEARDLASQLAREILIRAMAGRPAPSTPAMPRLERRQESAVAPAIAGEYATDLGVLAFRPERGELCAYLFDRTLRLAREPGNWFRVAPASEAEGLPPSLQPLTEMRLQTRRLAGREVLIARRAERELRLGERLAPVSLSARWRARLGRYAILNADPGFAVVDTRLEVRDGRLYLSYRMPRLAAERIQVPLQPVSDDDAIILGLGRTRGETVRMVQIDDEERLRFSGLIGRRV